MGRRGGGTSGQYETVSDDEALDIWAPWIGSLFHGENAMCLFWVVGPKIEFCLEFVRACGFRIPNFGPVWIKRLKSKEGYRGNPGAYWATNLEPTILGVRGSMPPVVKMMPPIHATDIELPDHVWDLSGSALSWAIETELAKHSEKPDHFRQQVDLGYPAEYYGPAIELFARKRYSDWYAFGNEVPDGQSIAGPYGNPYTMETPAR